MYKNLNPITFQYWCLQRRDSDQRKVKHIYIHLPVYVYLVEKFMKTKQPEQRKTEFSLVILRRPKVARTGLAMLILM